MNVCNYIRRSEQSVISFYLVVSGGEREKEQYHERVVRRRWSHVFRAHVTTCTQRVDCGALPSLYLGVWHSLVQCPHRSDCGVSLPRCGVCVCACAYVIYISHHDRLCCHMAYCARVPAGSHAEHVDIGLWRLQLQRRLRRCAARAVRLLPHARWHTRPFKQGHNVGAAQRFPRHVEDDVSTMLCVCVCLFVPCI